MTETASNKIKQLAGLVRRLQDNPAFMAHILTVYQRQERLSDEALGAQLGATPEMVIRLALCKRPGADSPQFAAQTRQIAAYTNIDAAQLASLIRQVDSLAKLSKRPQESRSEQTNSQAPQVYSGLLAAARDRTEPEEDDQLSTDQEIPPEV